MNTNNRPGPARYIFLAVLFIAIITAVLLVANLQKKKGAEAYARMQKASLPIISLSLPEGFETDLHGYVKEMNLLDMRDVIVPLSSEKSLNLTVRPCGSSVTSLAYEVRDLKGETLIDSGNIANVDQSKDTEITLKFSELIESGTEYHLVLTLSFSDRSPVRYYTRILYARTNYIDQLLEFVNTFSNATYNADEADFIVNYIQPTDTSSTEDFYYTTIHSKYAMFTFSGTEVERLPGVKVRITEMEPTQLSVTLEYSIVLDPQDSERTCDVREFFCTRSRSQKVYLLDYYRTVEQRFEADTSTAEKGRIILGVGDGQNQIINSANDVHTVFVDNREIRSYNAKTNAMNLIFSFEDDTDDTGRSSFDHHDMRIVKVTNEGDVDYMVYGYMNRGVFEGQVGICFYRYQAAENATKRLFFMPVAQSEQMLMMDLGTLAYVNDADVCYLRYGDGIYSIDLNTGESVEVSIRAYPGMYAMNERGNVVAWQEGDDLN